MKKKKNNFFFLSFLSIKCQSLKVCCFLFQIYFPCLKGKDHFLNPLTLPCLIVRKLFFPVKSFEPPLKIQTHTDISNPVKYQHSDLECMPLSCMVLGLIPDPEWQNVLCKMREEHLGQFHCVSRGLSSQYEVPQCMEDLSIHPTQVKRVSNICPMPENMESPRNLFKTRRV